MLTAATQTYDWDFDIGAQLYAETKAVHVSLPHVLNIAISGIKQYNVSLFGAYHNARKINHGNSPFVTVTYTSNPLTGPTGPTSFTYTQLLYSLLANPIQVGMVRINTVTQTQATKPIALINRYGTGNVDGTSEFPLVYPNQFFNNISYIEKEMKIDGYTAINYLQAGATDSSIQMYFYSNKNIELSRALSGNNVITDYARPQWLYNTPVEIIDERMHEIAALAEED